MTEPVVSVVLNYHNRPRFIEAAIDSVLDQTYQDWELVLLDGGSEPPLALSERAEADPRVRLIRFDDDLGYQDTTVYGWNEARGRYITNLHDDNTFEPEFMEKLVPALEADPSLVAAFSDHWWIHDDDSVDVELSERQTEGWGRNKLRPGKHEPFLDQAVVEGSVPIVMSTIIRKDAITWAVPKESDIVFDLWLAYAIGATDRGAWYCPERLARYRVHEERLTVNGGVRLHRAFLYCWRQFVKDPRLAPYRSALIKRIKLGQGNLAIGLAASGDRKAAIREARRGLRLGVDPRLLAILGFTVLPGGLQQKLLEVREGPAVADRLAVRRERTRPHRPT